MSSLLLLLGFAHVQPWDEVLVEVFLELFVELVILVVALLFPIGGS